MAQPKATTAGRYRYQYAAKILCTANAPGTSQTTASLLPGSYQTVVNLHNATESSAKLRMKLALVIPPTISKWVDAKLKPDEAMHVDCERMSTGFEVPPGHGLEGFLVVQSTHSLDVVAVYTAGPVGQHVSSLDVEHVPERVLGK